MRGTVAKVFQVSNPHLGVIPSSMRLNAVRVIFTIKFTRTTWTSTLVMPFVEQQKTEYMLSHRR